MPNALAADALPEDLGAEFAWEEALSEDVVGDVGQLDVHVAVLREEGLKLEALSNGATRNVAGVVVAEPDGRGNIGYKAGRGFMNQSSVQQ